MEARELHQQALVVETHNDLILLVDHYDRKFDSGHFGDFWLPELRKGGIDVQVLPICLEEWHQSEGALRRTLLLVERIHRLAEQYPDDVSVCLTADDVDQAVRAGKIALIIALEGAHGIGQDPALMRTMARAGVRVVSMAHFGRTFLADGSGLDDTSSSRLTPQGLEVLSIMEELGVVFDISHLGLAGVEHVLEVATRPFLATHSACRGIVDIHRNLDDDQLKGIAALGGVVSVAAGVPMFIDPANPSADRVVDHIERMAGVMGIDHVGIGPDLIDDVYGQIFGEWIPVPGAPTDYERAEILRPSDIPLITDAMVRRGFSEEDVRKVLGENVMRVLRDVMGVPAHAHAE